MRKISILGMLSAALTLWVASSAPVFSDGPITVSVTAQAQACVTIETTAINFGTLAWGGSAERQISNVANCSGVTQTLLAQGANTTSGPPWQLAETGTCPTRPLNQFRLEVDSIAGTPVALSSTTAKSLGTMATTPARTLDTLFMMPCSGSTGAGQTAQTTITLTATIP